MAYIKHRADRPKPYLVRWQDADGTERAKAFRTKADAEQYKGVVESGRVGAQGVTLWQAVQHWLGETKATCRPATLTHYKYASRKAFAHLGRTVKVAAITPEVVAQYRDEIAKTLHPKTVTNHLRAIRALLSYCERRGWVTVNVVKAVRFPRYRSKIPRWLDDDQSAALVAVLADAPADIRLALLFALRAGMRVGDFTRLRWDGQRADGWIVEDGKSKHPRIVPIHRDIAAALVGYPRKGDYVFPNRVDLHRHRDIHMFARLCNVWLKGKGFPATCHALRHSYCSALARAGASIDQIRQLAGHVSIETSLIYVHSAEDDNRRLVDKIGCADQGLRVLSSGSGS